MSNDFFILYAFLFLIFGLRSLDQYARGIGNRQLMGIATIVCLVISGICFGFFLYPFFHVVIS